MLCKTTRRNASRTNSSSLSLQARRTFFFLMLSLTNGRHAVTVLTAFSTGIYSATTCSLRLISTKTRTIPLYFFRHYGRCLPAREKEACLGTTRSLLLDSFFASRCPFSYKACCPFHSAAANWRSEHVSRTGTRIGTHTPTAPSPSGEVGRERHGLLSSLGQDRV